MKNTIKIRDDIMEHMMPAVPFDGWTQAAADEAARAAGYDAVMARAVFPGGAGEMAAHFADMADRAMLRALEGIDGNALKVRERIALAVRKRLEWLNGRKETEREAVAFWMRPVRHYEGTKIVWRTADRIWQWAGDTATDYNRYTKRALLAGVLTATTLYWLKDSGKDLSDSFAFLDRRIDNVLQLGRIIGGIRTSGKKRA